MAIGSPSCGPGVSTVADRVELTTRLPMSTSVALTLTLMTPTPHEKRQHITSLV